MHNNFLRNTLWTLPFICFCIGYFALSNLYHIEEVNVPTVVGLQLEQALELLAQHNLNVRLMHFKEDDLLPERTVISQTPPNGQKIKPHQSIYLVVSKKPDAVQAPACVGKPLSELQNLFAQQKIVAKIYHLPSFYPLNSCFAQHPQADQELTDNKMVVYVSKGNAKPIILPNLIGKPLEQVIEFLSAYPVEPEIIPHSQEQPEHNCASCPVTDQRPLPGSIMTLNIEKPLPIKLKVH
jgi:beta-lactam-binding protein with PASTA domain